MTQIVGIVTDSKSKLVLPSTNQPHLLPRDPPSVVEQDGVWVVKGHEACEDVAGYTGQVLHHIHHHTNACDRKGRNAVHVSVNGAETTTMETSLQVRR